jgi:hypothetical protein
VVIWQSRTSHVMTEETLGGVSAGCKPLQTIPKIAMATLNGGFRATVLTTPGTATRAVCGPRAGLVGDGRGVVHQRAKRFPHFKPGDLFGRNWDGVARFRVAAGARLAVATCCKWVLAKPQYRVRRRPKARTPCESVPSTPARRLYLKVARNFFSYS